MRQCCAVVRYGDTHFHLFGFGFNPTRTRLFLLAFYQRQQKENSLHCRCRIRLMRKNRKVRWWCNDESGGTDAGTRPIKHRHSHFQRHLRRIFQHLNFNLAPLRFQPYYYPDRNYHYCPQATTQLQQQLMVKKMCFLLCTIQKRDRKRLDDRWYFEELIVFSPHIRSIIRRVNVLFV